MTATSSHAGSKSWVEARKRNFPTREREKQVSQSKEERIRRGEVLVPKQKWRELKYDHLDFSFVFVYSQQLDYSIFYSIFVGHKYSRIRL